MTAAAAAEMIAARMSENDPHAEIDVGKLQLLLYDAQAWHLACTGLPLFSDPILAGPAGPYVASVAALYGCLPAAAAE